MNNIFELNSYRREWKARGANARVIAEKAALMCETAFLAGDWKMFERYLQIVKSARSVGKRNPGERVCRLFRN